MAKKVIKEKTIEEALWESANKLRGSVEPSEYKHVVLSLIFLKYAHDRFTERRNELAIRKQLLQNHLVEAIVILPRNMFYSTDISVTLWILNNNKKARTVEQNGKMVRYRNREDEVLFIDLRQWGEPFEKKYIQFSPEQIQQIAENFHNWQRVGYEEIYHDEPEYCYSATIDEIEKKGWSLVPSKYIEFRNRDEQIDFDTKMRQLQTEFRDLLVQEEESKQQLKELQGKRTNQKPSTKSFQRCLFFSSS